MSALMDEEEFRNYVGPHREVTRDRYSDAASAFTIGETDLARTQDLLNRANIQYGEQVTVKPHAEFKMCEAAQLIVGDRCIFNEFVFFQLTMPGPRVIIGDWVSFGRHTMVAAKNEIVIGSYTQIGPFCHILDHDHGTGANNLILNQMAVIDRTTVGQDCWIGSGSRILKGATIGTGSVVGAGSVVACDIPSYEIWGGVPARFIRKREET